MNDRDEILTKLAEISQAIYGARDFAAVQKTLRDLYLGGFTNATAFLALVITAGYTGMFALWGRIAHYLTYSERMVTAGFMGLSLGVFIGWQLWGQWVLSQQQIKIVGLIDDMPGDQFPKAFERFKEEQKTLRIQLTRLTPMMFGITVALAAVGMIALVLACFEHLSAGR